MHSTTRSRSVTRSLKALGLLAALAGVVLVAGAFLASRQRDPLAVPPLAMQEAEAHLAFAGDQIEWTVPAFRRRWWDYFQPTRGVLIVTERRLVFVGLVPEPLALGSDEEPPGIERISFDLDSTTVVPRRTGSGATPGVDVVGPGGEKEFFRIHPRAWQRAESLMVIVSAIHEQREAEAEAARITRLDADADARRALFHRVRRGETLIGIAAQYGLTSDSLARLNSLPTPRIREGDSLLVRPELP